MPERMGVPEQPEFKEIKNWGFKVETKTEPNPLHPERNEDSLLNDPEHRVFGVFDGLGGGEAGDVASSLVANFFKEHGHELGSVPQNEGATSEKMVELFERAQKFLVQEQEKSQRFAMGTTAAVVHLWFEGDSRVGTIANVGDSRVYILRKTKLDQLTLDDSDYVTKNSRQEAWEMQRMLSSMTKLYKFPGGEKYNEAFKSRHIVSQHIGAFRYPKPDVSMYYFEPGDKIILVTDGISDNLTDDKFKETIRKATGNKAEALVESAKKKALAPRPTLRSKPDDFTAIVIEVE